MADSDSGTHVTDISEGLQDELDVRKEGIRIVIALGFLLEMLLCERKRFHWHENTNQLCH